jgi:ferredoxin
MPSAPDTFTVVLRRSGTTVEVGPDQTILQAVRAVVEVDFFCRRGECGTCVQSILAGKALHRDTVLSSQAREAGQRIAICVSRSMTDVLVLDL